jgi:CRISPR-associated protein Cas2
MYVLVTYDVTSVDKARANRLRTVAKICLEYGQRVQNSVFEMKLAPAQWTDSSTRLVEAIDQSLDSLRFYHLGNIWADRIDHFGVRKDFDIDGFLNI